MLIVSGINFNNYTADQLKELKNNGVAVPDEAIKKAEARAAEEAEQADAKASDEANMTYELTDNAAEVNEAEELVAFAEESGASLKGILTNLMAKCAENSNALDEMGKELTGYNEALSLLGMGNEEIEAAAKEDNEKATAEIADLEAEMDNLGAKIEAKSNSLNSISEKVEDGTVSADDAETIQAEIDDLDSETGRVSDKLRDKAAKLKDKAEESTNKLKVNAEQAKAIGDKLTDVTTKAQNANEFANVTIDKGMEANQISSNKEARKAGFKAKGLAGAIVGTVYAPLTGGASAGMWAGFEASKKQAHNMGAAAVATGADLGNKTQSTANTVKDMAESVGMTIAEGSSINNILSKEYADTSKLAELKSGGGRSARKENAKILNEIVKDQTTIKDYNELQAKKKAKEEPKTQS